MKSGLKKLTSDTQGGRANQSCKMGEKLIQNILNVLGIKNQIDKFNEIVSNEIKLRSKDSQKMKPDFAIWIEKESKWILLESKFKQIAGSDWEKIESNFGFHEYYYNNICGINSRTIVILTGFWKELQGRQYENMIPYFRNKYGNDCIFDFCNKEEYLKEISSFAKIFEVVLTEEILNTIKNLIEDLLKIQ